MELQAPRRGPTSTQLISEKKNALLEQTIDLVTSTKSVHQFLHPPPPFSVCSVHEMRRAPDTCLPPSRVKAVYLLTDTDQ